MASRRSILGSLASAAASIGLDALSGRYDAAAPRAARQVEGTVDLPDPATTGSVAVESAIAGRRSRRAFGDAPLALREVGQLLWAAQGITDRASGHRSTPSAGGLYPLEVFVVVGEPGAEGLAAGVYRYQPGGHRLALLEEGNVQSALRAAAVDQGAVERAAVDVVITAVDERTTAKYGGRGERRYVPMEAGHAGENLYLQAEALGLSTVSIGAFDDERVRELVGAPENHRPLYVFPVGKRA